MGAMIVGVVILVLIVLVELVWVFGSRAKARLAANYPPPGQMVDVGGYRLHVHCQGNPSAGGPTVVLDSAHLQPSLSWGSIPERVARFARVCTYDRAGQGWSDAAPSHASPRTSSRSFIRC